MIASAESGYGLPIKVHVISNVRQAVRASGLSVRHIYFYAMEVHATSQSRCLGDGLPQAPITSCQAAGRTVSATAAERRFRNKARPAMKWSWRILFEKRAAASARSAWSRVSVPNRCRASHGRAYATVRPASSVAVAIEHLARIRRSQDLADNDLPLKHFTIVLRGVGCFRMCLRRLSPRNSPAFATVFGKALAV